MRAGIQAATCQTGSGWPWDAFRKAKLILSNEKLINQGPKLISITDADPQAIQRLVLPNKDLQITTINMAMKIDGKMENFTRAMESLCKRANGNYRGMGGI